MEAESNSVPRERVWGDKHLQERVMRLLGAASTMVVSSCILPMVAASQADPRPPEVQRLGFYVGRWSEVGEMRDDPTEPFQAVSGDETCSWAAGGYAVVCEEKTTGPGGGWEGVYILSYDAAGERYHVYGTEKPGSNIHAVGRADGDRWVWETDPAPDGSRVRYTFAPAGADARTMTVEAGAGDSWFGVVNIEYTRRR